MSEAQKRIPRAVPDRGDARGLPLSPTDGFVLSRVDGALNEDDIAAVTGLPDAQVRASLSKLEELGLVTFSGTAPAPSTSHLRASSVHLRAAPVAPVAPASGPALTPTPAAPAPVAASAPGPTARRKPTAAEQAMLDEDVDIDVELRRRVLDLHRDLDRRDHYELLGVGADADRKAIKRAYFELAATFHPDRYFRKKLGSFKVRMEGVFARLTIAHDTVSDREKRAEYDAYLGQQRISRAIEEHLASGFAQAQRAEEAVEQVVRDEVRVIESTQPSAPPPRSTGGPAPEVDLAARREALARRLLGGKAPRTSTAPPAERQASPPPISTGDAMNALKRRYEDRIQHVKSAEARKYAKQAETALAAADLVAAATAFRVAANLAPGDAELEKKARDTRTKADAILSETYMKQAIYEESHSQWAEASRSWARVCKTASQDARAHERAANAIVRGDGDLHDAVRLAQRACDLDPRNPSYRVTLASCYTAAGLALNARRELETAAQLAPHDDTIQAMIRKVGQPS